jgi:hypothetical protein
LTSFAAFSDGYSRIGSNQTHNLEILFYTQTQNDINIQYRQRNRLITMTEEKAAEMGLTTSMVRTTLMTYRSVGIGFFGAVMRYAGMPLEKIALFMNSSQVQGKGQFAQAVRLTFKEGALAPYRVVGPTSLYAWFLQYSVMGVAFQFFDQSLSRLLDVEAVYYGSDLMRPAPAQDTSKSMDYHLRSATARLLSPILAACLESTMSNRAEVQRYFGPNQFSHMEKSLYMNTVARTVGPAFRANIMRNVIMCNTSFLLTPITYRLYFPQEQKSKTSLFWYGLSLNVFVGNVAAITQQALWGRSLDYLQQHGHIHYRTIVQQGLCREGTAAFFTLPKWFSRVLMNAPAQGTLPWFYNEVLPLGEDLALQTVKSILYNDGDLVISPDPTTTVFINAQTSPSLSRRITSLQEDFNTAAHLKFQNTKVTSPRSDSSR